MANQLRVIGVIPARLASTRLPEKMLQDIHGRPLIYYTWRQAKQATELNRVIVACDHKKIAAAVTAFGGEALLTSPDHTSGTARAAEVSTQLSTDIIVNIQGDEPLMHPDTIDAVARILRDSSAAIAMATASVNYTDEAAYRDPNVVKVVTAADGCALYFSRAPIPHDRDTGKPKVFKKHLGIYAYRHSLLARLAKLPPSPLAEQEKLEQLTPLAAGVKIVVASVIHDSIGVDTLSDLERVRTQLNTIAPAKS
jgi:3-deoxy-manno-octulosonate cytidylyltransferase (CMP-KDO synthetase)